MNTFRLPMRLFFAALSLLLFSHVCLAEPTDKWLVDIILFQHNKLYDDANERSLIAPILLPSSKSIPLALGDYSAMPDYRNLPFSQSELRQTYAGLKRSPDYQVLARYTWLQPDHIDRAIDLPPLHWEPWKIHGRIQLKPGRFPFLKTNLIFSNDEQIFALRHNQALKLKQTYYLDHPIIGMLIRLTPVAAPDSNPASS